MDCNLQIIIDDRESAVIPHFKEYKNMSPNITFKVDRINIGDYSVVYKHHILMTIERKTWKDLSSSLRDGRKDNVNKMLKLREDTGCKIFYLIEGNPLPNPKIKFCRVPYKNLRSHLDHLIFRDDIHVIHSKNQANTVERIFELVKNYLSIKPSPLLKYNTEEPTDDEIKTTAITKLKVKTVVSDESITYKIWTCVPNITEKTSALFINKDYHIAELILGEITKEQIYALKYDNGYVIGKRSETIWNGSRIKSCNNKYFIKMLACINGITKKTAEIILEKISFKELLEGKISLEDLSSIKKNENTNVVDTDIVLKDPVVSLKRPATVALTDIVLKDPVVSLKRPATVGPKASGLILKYFTRPTSD